MIEEGDNLKVEEIIAEVAKLSKQFGATEIILYGSRAKGCARERSDIDIAISGVKEKGATAKQAFPFHACFNEQRFLRSRKKSSARATL